MPCTDAASDPQVWFDLTVLVYTPNPQPTGIPRTVMCICQEWLAAGYTNLRFCALDKNKRVFVEVEPEAILARFVAQSSQEHPNSTLPALPSPWSLLFKRLSCHWQFLPRSLRFRTKEVGRQLNRLIRLAGRILQLTVRIVRRWIERLRPVRPAQLRSADLLVSPGGGWIIPGTSEVYWRLKQEQKFRVATIIYDLIPVKFPHFFGPGMAPAFRHWNTNTVWTSDLLLTISRHTRQDLLDFCHETDVPVPAVEVLRLGEDFVSESEAGSPPPHPAFTRPEPFVLSVGTIEVRKNHLLLYQVWRRLVEELGQDAPYLVLVGSRGWLAEDLHYLIQNDPQVKGRILTLAHMTDRQLRWLYRHCLFTMYPSHYEGWGLPIAESLRFGKYCIASNTSSMCEVGGDLVGRHDPCDMPACLRLVRQALDPAFRSRQEERIRAGYHPVSWSETARQFVTLLHAHFGPVLRKEAPDVRDEGVAGRPLPHPAQNTRRSA